MAVNPYSFLASIVFVVVLALPIMGFFGKKNHFIVDGRTVLLTGGSQGMGRGLAKLLAQKGANVILVARNVEKLEEAIKYISAAKIRESQRFHYISADVAKPEENDRILREAAEWNNGQSPDIVWANAGSSIPKLFLETSIDTLRSQMDINYWAATYLAHSTLRVWLKPSETPLTSSLPKHFIMTSSSLAFCGIAGYNPYSPAKAAMRSLADGLRSEINMYNGARLRSSPPTTPEIKIHCIFPGTILSPGHEIEQTHKHPVTMTLEDGDPVQTEDEVALESVKGLEKGDFLIATQFLSKLMRASSLNGSPRNGWGITDVLLGWVVCVAWLFIGPDMEGKVFKWGKQNGIQVP